MAIIEKQNNGFFYLLLGIFVLIFHVYCMFLQSLSLNSFGWMYFVHDKWINSSMDGWYDEHLNVIQMDESHSSIFISYLSTQSTCIMVKITYTIYFEVYEYHPL
jgi:hypothetical protein